MLFLVICFPHEETLPAQLFEYAPEEFEPLALETCSIEPPNDHTNPCFKPTNQHSPSPLQHNSTSQEAAPPSVIDVAGHATKYYELKTILRQAKQSVLLDCHLFLRQSL